jgi:ADP-ribose pyrophosphatase YjhB (NUDIX family)
MSSAFEEKDYTLVFCRKVSLDGKREILLGMKKRGFGIGKWNGFGGKLEGTETIEEGAIRELEEESCIRTSGLRRRGFLVFKLLDVGKIMRVHVFDTFEFSGEPTETEEMRPKWYNEDEIPFDSMWLDDKYWFSYLLEGKSFIGR